MTGRGGAGGGCRLGRESVKQTPQKAAVALHLGVSSIV